MVTQTFNRTEDLEQKIGYTDDTVDEADLQTVLEEAHQQMQARVGRHFIEDHTVRKTSDDELVNELNLKFNPVFEVDEILYSDHEIISDSDYTVDKEKGEITLDSSFVDENLDRGRVLRIKYIPEIFKQVELWRAIEIMKNQEIVELEDSEQAALNTNALQEARRLENMINRRTGPGTSMEKGRRGTP